MKKAARAKAYLSLYINCIIFLMVFMGSVWMMTDIIPSSHGGFTAIGAAALKYFTVDSNLLMGFTSVLLAAYNVLALLGRRSRPSRALSLLAYAAVTGVGITFLTVIVFLAPASAFTLRDLYRDSNLFFHLLVPLLALVDFFLLFPHERLHLLELPLGILPFLLYGVCYCGLVAAHAGADGSIPPAYDWYRFFGGSTSHLALKILLLAVCGALFGLLVLLLSNLRLQSRAEGHPGSHTGFHFVSSDLESNVATASEYYVTRAFRIICVVAPLVGMCAGGIFTALWITGNFPFRFLEIFAFDAVCLSFPVVALFLYHTCIGPDGIVIGSKVRLGKTILTLLLLLQWNLISYLAPFREFWAYSFLFVLLSALFLDSRLVLINIVTHLASIAVSCFVKGEELLPPPGPTYLSSLVLRICLLLLGFTIIYGMIYLIERTLLTTLDKLSDYDILTHALNRRRFKALFAEMQEDYRANGHEFCLAMADLDEFKAVNDSYGHAGGDEVLTEFVRVIQSSTTNNDIVFRFGGEEFVILFRCGIETAYSSCCRILQMMAGTSFGFMPEGECVSATIGIARYEDGMSPEELLKLADERLYAGKQAGRNRVVIEPAEEMSKE